MSAGPRCALVALALAAALATPAQASVPDLIGLGPRTAALGGLGAADCDDFECTYVNPGGLAGARTRRLTLGYIGARDDLKLDGAHRDVAPTDGILIGATLPLPFGGVLRNRLAIGIGFYFPVGLVNRAQQAFADQPRLALLDTRTQTVSVLVGLGVRLHERVNLGVGVLALAALVGHIAIRTDAAGAFTTVSEEQLVTAFTPVVGVQVHATGWLHLGLTLRGESRSDYDIKVTADLGSAVPLTLPTIRIAGTSQYDPLQLQLDAAFDVHRHVRLLAGVTYKHWASFADPVHPATLGAPQPPPPDFHDTAVPRVAAEFSGALGARFRLTGRVGYWFDWSPTPGGDQSVRTLLDADTHVVTLGLAAAYQGRLTGLHLDLFGQLHALAGGGRAQGTWGAFGGTFGVDL